MPMPDVLVVYYVESRQEGLFMVRFQQVFMVKEVELIEQVGS